MKIAFNNNSDLANTLKGLVGSSFCSMELTTPVKMLKKSRTTKIAFDDAFKGQVFKTYQEVGNFNVSYENAVNNQRKREDVEQDEKFVANSLPWGEWVEGGENKVLTHKGEFYLRYYTGMSANSKKDKKTVYHYANGEELTQREMMVLNEYTSAPRKKSTTQGVSKEVTPRAVKMGGIKKIVVGGTTYTRK